MSAGSAVLRSVPPGEIWAGSPAVFVGAARHRWPDRRAPRRPGWVAAYGVTAVLLSCLPLVAAASGLLVIWVGVRDAATLAEAAAGALRWVPLGALTMFAVQALLTLVSVRLLGVGLTEGYHPVRSRTGWQVWATERLMDDARSLLFPLYASLVTPVWLRALGARIGRDVEASTVLMLPRMTTVGDGAFLADDTMVGSYELGGGWMRIERARVGKRAFLGNSGMTAPGRVVPKRGLVAVLSATPERAKAGTLLARPPAGAGCAARPRRATRRARSRRPGGCASPAARSRCCGSCRWSARSASASGVLLALQACLDRWGLAGRGAARRAGACSSPPSWRAC